MEIVISLAVLAAGAVLIVLYLKAWNKSKSRRQAAAEAQRQRNGGQAVLEWSGPKAQGADDPEFGELLVEIPKKRGGGSARFYRKGADLDGRRLSYEDLKDAAFAERTPALIQTPKNAAVMWLYFQKGKGSPVSLSSLTYTYEDSTMRALQTGLGFGHS